MGQATWHEEQGMPYLRAKAGSAFTLITESGAADTGWLRLSTKIKTRKAFRVAEESRTTLRAAGRTGVILPRGTILPPAHGDCDENFERNPNKCVAAEEASGTPSEKPIAGQAIASAKRLIGGTPRP